jgi:hypothetical protein
VTYERLRPLVTIHPALLASESSWPDGIEIMAALVSVPGAK